MHTPEIQMPQVGRCRARYSDEFKRQVITACLEPGVSTAAVMSLIQSAKLNGHDPYAYLKDVLARLPTQKNSQIDELLPHRWQPTNP